MHIPPRSKMEKRISCAQLSDLFYHRNEAIHQTERSFLASMGEQYCLNGVETFFVSWSSTIYHLIILQIARITHQIVMVLLLDLSLVRCSKREGFNRVL